VRGGHEMNTTNFYVELIVIGLGPFLCLVLVSSTLFAIDPATMIAFVSWGNFVMLLPIIYLLGIITDRGADALFDCCWESQMKKELSDDQRRAARCLILTKGEKLAELIEYGRSRMRICRGWAFNCPLLMVAVAVYALREGLDHSDLFLIELMLAVLAVAAWFSWRTLARSDYQKVKDSGKLLKT